MQHHQHCKMACSSRQEIPFNQFPRVFTMKLMNMLMTKNSLLDNWENLAAYLGFDLELHSILKEELKFGNNPVEVLLDYYRRVPGFSVEKFLAVLNKMKRPDLVDIKREIEVFLEERHATNSSERICSPTEDDETVCYNVGDKDLVNYYSAQKRKLYKENLIPYKLISSPPQYMERNPIPSEYPHMRMNTSPINYIESNGQEWNGHFENDKNFNGNSYLIYHSKQLIPKGPDLGNNRNINSNNSMTDETRNVSSLDITNSSNQKKHNGVNKLSECPQARVISIDSKTPHKTIELKIQNTDHMDKSSLSSGLSQRLSPLPSLMSGDLNVASINPHKDSNSIIFITYANDMKGRAKQLAKFLRRAKSNLEVILVEDYSPEKANNIRRWVDFIVENARFIIVIASPQYKVDADNPSITDDSNLLVRYIADQLHNQYYNNGCNHIKARVIYFEQSDKICIPEFLKSTIPFNYRIAEEWRQFYYMVINQYS